MLRWDFARRYPAAVPLSISLLGPPSVKVDGAPLDVDTRKAVALLAYLAVTDAEQPRDGLVELLWPDGDPERTRSSLRRTLSTLRRALGDRWVEADRSVVGLVDAGSIELDVDRFMALATDLHGHDASSTCPRCIADLAGALALYRGEFMSGFALRDAPGFESWMMAESERLRRLAGGAFDRLAAAHAAAGDYRRAIVAAERRRDLDPLHESAHRLLMSLHAWSGDRAGAIDAYRRAVAVFDTELGVPPLAETTDLYEAILSGDLPRPPAPVRDRPTRPPSAVGGPLVGRSSELGIAQEVLNRGHGVVLVEGPPGAGRTRFLAEVAAGAALHGHTVLTGRGHASESAVPYSVVHAALSGPLGDEPTRARITELPEAVLVEAARLFPALARPRSPSRHPAAKTRFLDAVKSVIAALDRPVLAIDDIDLVDQASAEFLGFLARRASDVGVVIVACSTSPHLRTDRTVDALIADLGMLGERIVLGPLGSTDIDVLIRDAGVDTSPDSVLAETGGLPLLVVEHLNRLRSGERGVGDVLRRHVMSRIGAVGDVATQVLTAAAVLGDDFDPELIAAVSGRTPEETDLALDELVRHGLLQEADEGRTSVANKSLAAVVLADATQARRRSLHRRAAAALARRHPDARLLASVAYHQAGAGNDVAAADAYRRAGEAAAAVFAHRDAVLHLQAAIAFDHPDRHRLQSQIGDLWTLEGEYGEALAAYESALAMADTDLVSDLEHRLGGIDLRLRRWDLATAHLTRALEHSAGDAGLRAMIAADASYAHHRLGHTEAAAAFMREALEGASKSGEAKAQAKAHNVAGLLATDPVERADHLLTALAVAADTPARVAVLNNLAVTAIEAGDATTAVARTTEALELAMDLGDRHLMAALHNNLADALHLAGESDQAMVALTEAVRLFVEVRAGTGTWDPEVWLLTEW